MQNLKLYILTMVASLSVLGGCSSSAEKKEEATTGGASSQPVAAKAKVKSAPLKSPMHLTFILDDQVEYAIDSVKKSKSLGEMKKGRTASEGNYFYIVSFRARNNGSEPVKVSTGAMLVRAVDSDGVPPSDAAKDAVKLNGGSDELFECKLQPGEEKPFLAIFDLPPSAIKAGADFEIPSTKPDSKDHWLVRLK